MAPPTRPSTLYFAYGRNMSAAAIDLACPGNRFLGPAKLPGHRLAFRRRSVRTGTGVVDVIPAPGHSAWGALYELPDAHALASLDGKEGRDWAYRREVVRVLLGARPRRARPSPTP